MTNKTIGQSTAHTNSAIIYDAVSVGSLASVKILDPEIVSEGQNPQRMGIIVSTLGKAVFIKFQAAAVDNDKKGIYLGKEATIVLDVEDMYFGEVSAIAISGTAKVYVTEL